MPEPLTYSSLYASRRVIGCQRLVLLGNLLHPLIVVTFLRIVIGAGHGGGRILFIIQNGLPSAWGTEVRLSKLAIVVLICGVFVIRPRPALFFALFGIGAVLLAWGTFFEATDSGNKIDFLLSSVLFLITVILRFLSAVPFVREQWFAVLSGRPVWKDTSIDLFIFSVCAILVIALDMMWQSRSPPEFFKK